ncbi:hypothetical protein HK102_008333, partial [Quaeritorhiza haematococci]
TWWFTSRQRAINAVKNLYGKRVLITGASKGIGEQLAYEYARHGARIVITARTASLLEQVAERCRSLLPTPREGSDVKPEIHVLLFDATSKKSCQDLIHQTAQILGGLDILVLNHIGGHKWGAVETPLTLKSPDPTSPKTAEYQAYLSEYDSLLRLTTECNYLSWVTLGLTALPYLLDIKKEYSPKQHRDPAQLVLVQSLSALIAPPMVHVYAASKSASKTFFDCLHHELNAAYKKFNAAQKEAGSSERHSARRVTMSSSMLGAVETEAFKEVVGKQFDDVVVSPQSSAAFIVKHGCLGTPRVSVAFSFPFLVCCRTGCRKSKP